MVNVRLAMDHVVSFMLPFICIALRPDIHALVLIFYPLYRLTFPKDLHILSSRIGRRLKKPSYIWMVYDIFCFLNSGIVLLHKFCNPISSYLFICRLKLMVKLSGPSLHYLRGRRLLLLPKLLLPHRGEIPQNLTMLLRMVIEMEENVQKMVRPHYESAAELF